MPPAAYTYALPADLAKREGLRRYGAHGTSYRYLVGAASQLLRRPASELNLIIGHLGKHPTQPTNDLLEGMLRCTAGAQERM